MIEKEKLAVIMGEPNLIFEKTVLESYSRDMSFVNAVRPLCVVKPGNDDEVKKLVNLANETQTPLVPVSSGPPHFRGDTVPGTGGTIIVDLSGMKRILNVDRPRRVAMVEPGVTFGELIPAATREGIRLNMPLLPRKSKSIVGSLLEREPVIMPKYQWDAADPLSCLGIIFGNGEEFRTGQSAGPGAIEEQWEVGAVQKSPFGPGSASWHRLIQGAQGTMGIVTWVSMRCELLPKLEEPFIVGSTNLEKLLELTGWLIRLRMVNECFILNKTNLAAISNIKETGIPDWALFYTVAGYEYYPEERVSTHIKSITNLTQRSGLEAVRIVGGLSAGSLMKMVHQPSEEPYWKLRPQGACEDIFFLTINAKLAGLMSAMSQQAEKARYSASKLGIYLQPMVQGTGLHCEFNLFYDPDNISEVQRVKDLSLAATKALLAQGAFFSRPYGESASSILNRDAASMAMLNKLKNMFDPNHIMNPGKIGYQATGKIV